MRTSRDLPALSSFKAWFAVTGTPAAGPGERRLADLPLRLEAAFDGICTEWWEIGRALADGPGAELAYAPTCAGYGSDFGLMMAWTRLTEEAAREKVPILVLCDDPWQFRQLATIPGVERGRAPPLWPATVKMRLRGVMARLRLVARLSLAALLTRRQRRAHRPGDPAILVYGHPGSDPNGTDAYFGSLMREIPELKRVLHTDCPVDMARKLAADGRTAALDAWGSPWKTPALLFARWRPSRDHRSGRWGWLVRRAAEMEASGGAHAINVWQRLCQEAWLDAVRPRVVAWPWENHGWERALCRAARRRGVETAGYQHTVIGRHQLNYSPATNADGLASVPDLVVCNGPAYRRELADWGIPEDRLVVGGAFRFERLPPSLYDPAGPVFVALSAIPAASRQLVAAAGRLAESGRRVLVKNHPMYPVAIGEQENLSVTETPLPEQAGISAVLYSTGTSGLEALLAGVPTFRLVLEDRVAVDVLPEGVRVPAVTARDVVQALTAGSDPRALDREDILAAPDLGLWQRLLSRDKHSTQQREQRPIKSHAR